MGQPWYERCLTEIDNMAKIYPRRLSDWEKAFLRDVRPKIRVGFSLNDGAEKKLLEINAKMTEPSRIPRHR